MGTRECFISRLTAHIDMHSLALCWVLWTSRCKHAEKADVKKLNRQMWSDMNTMWADVKRQILKHQESVGCGKEQPEEAPDKEYLSYLAEASGHLPQKSEKRLCAGSEGDSD